MPYPANRVQNRSKKKIIGLKKLSKKQTKIQVKIPEFTSDYQTWIENNAQKVNYRDFLPKPESSSGGSSSQSAIQQTSRQLSLICPLSMKRLSLPCKFKTCTHLECFNGVEYLKMIKSNFLSKNPNSQIKCPICNKIIIKNLYNPNDPVTKNEKNLLKNWKSSKSVEPVAKQLVLDVGVTEILKNTFSKETRVGINVENGNWSCERASENICLIDSPKKIVLKSISECIDLTGSGGKTTSAPKKRLIEEVEPELSPEVISGPGPKGDVPDDLPVPMSKKVKLDLKRQLSLDSCFEESLPDSQVEVVENKPTTTMTPTQESEFNKTFDRTLSISPENGIIVEEVSSVSAASASTSYRNDTSNDLKIYYIQYQFKIDPKTNKRKVKNSSFHKLSKIQIITTIDEEFVPTGPQKSKFFIDLEMVDDKNEKLLLTLSEDEVRDVYLQVTREGVSGKYFPSLIFKGFFCGCSYFFDIRNLLNARKNKQDLSMRTNQSRMHGIQKIFQYQKILKKKSIFYWSKNRSLKEQTL